ncbi:efflux RND transporter periplasmic adaptor subunit [Cyclobacterium sp.]|uniref:efflux RND transporter periplasmic adaptor subunit n=1 Tax=Cyclobacterium sp. TaxID=1966343 RepID=UPI0019C40DE3|nr:efflux RND transporter periplasmic adaptor subunit [Cyclobacterium sp.]MBD3631299.1 efflux RND transporter periplasmic adaptor subunit [Cyclobacterium sp.]
MKKLNKSLFLWISVFAMMVSCGGKDQEADSEQEVKEAVAVEAQPVEKQIFPQIIRYTANVEAWEQAYITGQTGVRIDEIKVEEGERVKRGQLLVTMNAAQLNQARSQMELASREVERLDTLVKIGSVSGQQFDQAMTEYQNALTNYENLAENTRLTANFDGVITKKYFFDGEMFTPSAEAPAILVMMQIEPIKITINVGEGFYNQVKKGMKATVRTDVYPEEEFSGQVDRKSPTIDRNSRTFRIEIRIENEERQLRPGMFARVSLNLGEIEGIYIPATAVVNQPGTTDQFVFVKEGDRVRRIAVETGNRYQDLIRVVSGLEAGKTIITEGIGKLNEGTLVRVVNANAQVE